MEKTATVSGCIAPMFTPFCENGELDWDGAAAFVDWLSETEGLDAIFVRSGMGQTYLWTADEIRRAPQIAVDAAQGRRAILVGTSGVWDRDPNHRPPADVYTEQTIEFSLIAKEAGAVPVVLVPAALSAATRKEAQGAIRAYFRA